MLIFHSISKSWRRLHFHQIESAWCEERWSCNLSKFKWQENHCHRSFGLEFMPERLLSSERIVRQSEKYVKLAVCCRMDKSFSSWQYILHRINQFHGLLILPMIARLYHRRCCSIWSKILTLILHQLKRDINWISKFEIQLAYE